MFVVRTDLFRTSQLGIGSNCVSYSKKHGFVRLVEWVNVRTLGRPLNCFSLRSCLRNLLLELLEIDGITLRKFREGSLCDGSSGGEEGARDIFAYHG